LALSFSRVPSALAGVLAGGTTLAAAGCGGSAMAPAAAAFTEAGGPPVTVIVAGKAGCLLLTPNLLRSLAGAPVSCTGKCGKFVMIAPSKVISLVGTWSPAGSRLRVAADPRLPGRPAPGGGHGRAAWAVLQDALKITVAAQHDAPFRRAVLPASGSRPDVRLPAGVAQCHGGSSSHVSCLDRSSPTAVTVAAPSSRSRESATS
jgi:hypothetical protein